MGGNRREPLSEIRRAATLDTSGMGAEQDTCQGRDHANPAKIRSPGAEGVCHRGGIPYNKGYLPVSESSSCRSQTGEAFWSRSSRGEGDVAL